MKDKNKKNGFTLVELLVASTLFVVFIGVSISVFIVFIDANRTSQEQKNLIFNLDSLVDIVSNDIRLGYSYYCDNQSGLEAAKISVASNSNSDTKDCSSNSNSNFIVFNDQRGLGQYTAYYFNGSNLMRARCEDDCGSAQFSLFSSDELEDFSFRVFGSKDNDVNQPIVSIFAKSKIDALDSNGESIEAFSISTSVTQRGLDIQGRSTFFNISTSGETSRFIMVDSMDMASCEDEEGNPLSGSDCDIEINDIESIERDDDLYILTNEGKVKNLTLNAANSSIPLSENSIRTRDDLSSTQTFISLEGGSAGCIRAIAANGNNRKQQLIKCGGTGMTDLKRIIENTNGNNGTRNDEDLLVAVSDKDGKFIQGDRPNTETGETNSGNEGYYIAIIESGDGLDCSGNSHCVLYTRRPFNSDPNAPSFSHQFTDIGNIESILAIDSGGDNNTLHSFFAGTNGVHYVRLEYDANVMDPRMRISIEAEKKLNIRSSKTLVSAMRPAGKIFIHTIEGNKIRQYTNSDNEFENALDIKDITAGTTTASTNLDIQNVIDIDVSKGDLVALVEANGDNAILYKNADDADAMITILPNEDTDSTNRGLLPSCANRSDVGPFRDQSIINIRDGQIRIVSNKSNRIIGAFTDNNTNNNKDLYLFGYDKGGINTNHFGIFNIQQQQQQRDDMILSRLPFDIRTSLDCIPFIKVLNISL